ncbi:small ubiquitin-related modifier 3-like [Halichondria panicea]|uniref:small ubiquitin-related modifier 3-like n=1 Tax=Halichondria panicea TaxID=6063 RepID=UPI00312B8D0F
MSEDSKPDVKPDVQTESEHINLKVTGQDGSVVHFKIKRNTPLKKLMQAYCDRQGFQLSTIRFVFDGNSVGPECTPNALEMDDEDTIEVFQQQTGGSS